jgi:hypothetical protein
LISEKPDIAGFSFASAGSGDYTDTTKPVEYLGRGNQKDKHDEADKRKKHEKDNDTYNNDKKMGQTKPFFEKCRSLLFLKKFLPAGFLRVGGI